MPAQLALSSHGVTLDQQQNAAESCDAMAVVEVAITIRCPRRDVARVMFDPRHDSQWIGGIVEVRRTETGPLRRGSAWDRISKSFRRRRVSTLRVEEIVPDRLLALRADTPGKSRIRYTLEGIPEGTIARIELWGGGGSGLRLPASLRGLLLRRSLAGDLDRLKWLVEAGGAC